MGMPEDSLPSIRTINELIQKGLAGKTPPRHGPKGYMDQSDFQQLGEVVKAMVAISASNGDEKLYAELKKLINTVANSKEDKPYPDRYDYTLINRIFATFGIDLDAAKLNPAEARQVLWTTKANLELMFDNWKKFLVEKEFVEPKTANSVIGAVELTAENVVDGHEQFYTGELIFTIENMRRINNVDETCLSLDGLNGNHGGRLSLSFFDPALPRAGKAVSKCGLSLTLVIGGNAAGKSTPPHFQFPSTAHEQNQQVKYLMVEVSRDVFGQFGQFGHPGKVRLSPTYGMNEKGGMDEAHFEKYITDLLAVLYPDCADSKGKRVVFKVDHGPGQSNVKLLVHLRARGCYLFPSVPNSSSVSQEMDQIFDLFKTLMRGNVEKLHSALMKIGCSVSLGRDDCCMIVFGGTHVLEDGSVVELEEAFDRSFCPHRVLYSFNKVGSVPLIRNCLSNKKVHVELEVDDANIENEDPIVRRLHELDSQLEACVSYLLIQGFTKARLLHVRAKRKKKSDQPVMLPYTLERQQAFLRAKTIGGKYKALNGTHITHDDMFILEEMRQCSGEIKAMTAQKMEWIVAVDRSKEAFELIQSKEEQGYPLENIVANKTKWTVPELDILLKWKLGKKSANMWKQEKLDEWVSIQGKPVEPVSPWMEEDEAKLVALQSSVEIEDTELGKAQRRMKQKTNASVATMTIKELKELKAKADAALVAMARGDLPAVHEVDDSSDDEEGSNNKLDGEDSSEGTTNKSDKQSEDESDEQSEEEDEQSEEEDEQSEEEDKDDEPVAAVPFVTRFGRTRKPNSHYI